MLMLPHFFPSLFNNTRHSYPNPSWEGKFLIIVVAGKGGDENRCVL